MELLPASRVYYLTQPVEFSMNTAGAWDKTKGAAKDAVGGLTGDTKLQAEGKMDKAKGAAEHAAQNVKDAAKDAKEDLSK
jgi:uncharacterized protein YjbJ (UPF0337 family)